MDIRELAGLPSDVAIGRIVDAFCPAGIADEDAVRSAVGETLAHLRYLERLGVLREEVGEPSAWRLVESPARS